MAKQRKPRKARKGSARSKKGRAKSIAAALEQVRAELDGLKERQAIMLENARDEGELEGWRLAKKAAQAEAVADLIAGIPAEIKKRKRRMIEQWREVEYSMPRKGQSRRAMVELWAFRNGFALTEMWEEYRKRHPWLNVTHKVA